MRFVDVKLKCGWNACGTVGSEGDGTVVTKTISVDGKPREIEICKKHQDELNEILQPLFADGRTAKGAPSTKSKSSKVKHPVVDLECKHPGCGRTMANTAGMAQHVKRTHGYASLDAYHESYPPSASG